jgi:competence protein ComEA
VIKKELLIAISLFGVFLFFILTAAPPSGLTSDFPTFSPAASIPAGEMLRVEVSGAVVQPGVYELEVGSRVIDAVGAAGGWNRRVDPLRVEICLNLAAPLVDGSAIRVPTRDDSFLLGITGISCGSLFAGPGEVAASDAAAPDGTQPGQKINLNTASADELDTLPGIGPVTAQKIITSREEAPFLIVDDLLERGIVSQGVLEKIRPLVIP